MNIEKTIKERKAWLEEFGEKSYLEVIQRNVETRNNLARKIEMVKNGESRIFADWSKHSTITEEEFIDGLKWLCNDEFTCIGKLRRELALSPNGLVKLIRCYNSDWNFAGFYKDGRLWSGETFLQYPKTEQEALFYGSEPHSTKLKICISALDRI